jgi:hypothetical protein
MLWVDPEGGFDPGRTDDSAYYSLTSVPENNYTQVRRFVIIRIQGSYSLCLSVKTSLIL